MRNDDIREILKVENTTERCSKASLRWFGHVKRRDQEYVGRKTLEMVPPGRRRGRPKQRWMDCVNRDMRAIGTTKSMTELAGGELCLTQRPHNQVRAARRRLSNICYKSLDKKDVCIFVFQLIVVISLGTTRTSLHYYGPYRPTMMSMFLEGILELCQDISRNSTLYFVMYQEDVINNQWLHCVDNDAIKYAIKD